MSNAPVSPVPATAHLRLRRHALLAVLGLLLASCTLYAQQHFRVTTGTKLYAHIFARPSWNISGHLYRDVCGQNIVCTADFLDEHFRFSGWGAAEFYDGIRDYADFWPAVDAVSRMGYQSLNDTGNGCLVLTKSLTMNLDWETRRWDWGRGDCATGSWIAP
jgi:hypothetical protein